MTNTIARQDFEDALSNQNVMFEDIRTDYSGRFMYGDTCFGIVVDHYGYNKVATALSRAAEMIREDIEGDEDGLEWDAEEELADKLDQLAEGVRTDNMGRDMIVYWPGWEFED